MPALEIWISFFVATAIFAYMPGPAMLYATAQTISGGKRAGWMAALGIHIGGYVHVIAAAAGLAILFETIPILYTLLKFAGAAYLIWLGIQLCITPKKTADDPIEHATGQSSFFQSITVEVLNPKTAIFFLAFLPQFTDATAGFPIWMQLLILGSIVNIMFSSADVICVVLSGYIVEWVKKSQSGNRILQRFGGGLLIGLGIHLALSQR